MTPDEMKVLARVANRNAIENDSPVVVDDSRLIAPINNDSNELPLSLEKLDARLDVLESIQDAGIAKVNQLESALGMVNGANDSPVQVLAQSLAQTRADVAELKSVSDVMRLSPADVLSGVIKPTKITSAVELLDANFKTAFATDTEKLNGLIVTSKTKVIRSFKDIGTRPKNLLNLDNAGLSASVLTKISGNANLINGGFSLTSNSGLRIIDLTNKDFELNSDIPKINATALDTNKINTVSGVIDRFDWITGSILKGSKTISLPVNSFYNGIYQNTASMPTSAPSTGTHFILVQNTTDFRYYMYKWNGSSAYAIVPTTATDFTESAISSGASVDVLFSGTSTYMGLKLNATGFYYIDPSPLNGTNILVENRNIAATNGVRPLHIVQCTPIDSSILSVYTQQTATLLKPTADQFYRLQGFDKYIKVDVSTGYVQASIVASGTILYFEDNNVLYSQGTGATANRIRLDNNSWLFNTISRKFNCNSSTVQGPVPAGYYNYQGKLVKMDGQGNVVFDSTRGEVVAYKFKNNKNYKLTVPALTAVSGVADFFPNFSLQIILTDLYISEDLYVRDESGDAIKTLEGLYYAKGDIAFTRANLLYSINADGKCSVYSGLAYLEIEPENVTTFGLRVWYTATAGVLAPLSSNNYLNTTSNRVFTTGVTGTGSDYTTDFTSVVDAIGTLAQITAKTRAQLLANPISMSDLSRFSTNMMYNIKQYQALGLISGKATMTEVAALGGLEIMSSVATNYTAKYIRVVSGVNYELVYVTQSNTIATATKNNSVLSGNLLLQIGSNLFNVDNSKDNLLVKVTSGFVFYDESDPVDLRSINSEGVITGALSATSDCLHFAWAEADGVSKIYWADVTNSNRLQRVASNWGYEYSARDSETSYSNIVLLIKKPIGSSNAIDEEDTSNETSSYTMHILDIANGTYSPLPVPDSNNNFAKGYKFVHGSFDVDEFPTSAASGAVTYWHRDASNNKPHINRVISVTVTGTPDVTTKYNTSSMGVRDTAALAINGEYSTDLSNALYYGVTNEWKKDNVAVQSKYYIDYDGNLAQSGPQFGDRALIVQGNYFVVFANNDNRSRYFSNGRRVAVTPGTLVAVSSSAAAQSADHKHNGLKMWGKDATGMFNRWLDFQVDVARQSNDASVSDVVDMVDLNSGIITKQSATILPVALGSETNVVHTSDAEISAALTLSNTAVIGGTGTTANKPATATANAGLYYHDSEANLLYVGAASTGVMGLVTAVTRFISGDGKLYITTITSGATTAVASGKIITSDNILKTASSGGSLTATSGAIGDRIQLSTGATNYRKLSHASSGAVVDLAIGDYVFNVSGLLLYKAVAAGTSAPLSTTAALKVLYDSAHITSAFTLVGSKYYLVSNVGAAVATALAVNDAIWVTDAQQAIIGAVVAADTALVSATHFGGLLFRVGENQNCLLELNLSTYTTGKIMQKDGTEYTFTTAAVSGNAAACRFLIIDGMVQDARAPRGTQIQVLDSSTVKTYTRVGYSPAQKVANSSLTAADKWFSN